MSWAGILNIIVAVVCEGTIRLAEYNDDKVLRNIWLATLNAALNAALASAAGGEAGPRLPPETPLIWCRLCRV